MQEWFSKWVGWVRVFSVLALIFGILIRVGDPLPISTIRNAAFDFYHQSKPRDLQPLPVAILDVDDNSIDEIGQWPWPRTRIAELVTKATADGAVAIGFDIVFSEPDRLSPPQIARDNPGMPQDLAAALSKLPENDDVLAEAFARSRVIVGQATVRTQAGNRSVKAEIVDKPPALIGDDPRPYLLNFPDILLNIPTLEENAAGHGMFATRPDADGVYRRVPLVMSVQGKIRLGLTPELLRIATGGETYAIRTSEAGIEGIILARQLIRTASDGTVWPYLTPSSRGRYVPAADLLSGRMPQGRLAGHLVLVGTSAIGLEDFRATPLGVPMAGVEIHAQVLENIMAQSLLNRPNYALGTELIVTLTLCFLVIIFAPLLSGKVLIGTSLVLLTTYVGTSYYLFWQSRLLLDPTFPVFSTIISIMLISTVNYLREERQRQQIRSAFGQYVSPDLVQQLSESGGEVTLGGESRDLTLLFSDVRGFTAIAEEFRDDPGALTVLMNRFLTILSQAILDHDGTIDKFMGDAVMAFWNAPLDNENHAREACAAALRMIEDVEEFNIRRMSEAKQASEETPDGKVQRINVGIGINTGQCVVGNMGSETRFDYTALGDPVNVASRLEGQSRYYGCPIILGQTTAQAVEGQFAMMELDIIRVVGKAVPENIFGLLGGQDLFDNPAFIAAFELNAQMLKDYRDQNWDSVETALAVLRRSFSELGIGLEDYLDTYESRVVELRADPPGEGWDGVFSSTRK